MNPAFSAFQQQIMHPLKFRLFLLKRLPSALFAGLRIVSFSEKQSVVAVRYNWFNQNPFRSMYFAIQSMAAEMSTGLLASAEVYRRQPSVSMLVIGLEARFYKKAVDKILFSCQDGDLISATVAQAIQTGESVTIRCCSIGTNPKGETVSEFFITWSFKVKS